jgi:mRNA interferase RelE/StbE
MSYEIFILRRAQKALTKLPQKDYQNIISAINNLAINPRPSGCKKSKDRPAYRIRVGVYRVIYEISDRQLIITVINVSHRKEIYCSN